LSLLGLDVGTTGTKAIVFSAEGEVLGEAYREYPLLHPRPGWQELDPNQVWQAVVEAVREAVSKAGSKDPVKALACSVQGEAVTPIDREGRPLANSIVTFDNRTVPQAEWWERELGRERIYEITGMPLHAMYTVNKIMWWRENMPEVFERAWKFLCYEDFVLYKLGVEPTIDHSMAARTMGFDVRRRVWSEEILSRAGIPVEKLPQTAPSGTAIGRISDRAAEELGLPKGVVAATGGHDQPCGGLGAGVIESGVCMDATGTVECLLPAFKEPVMGPELREGNLPCYPHVHPDLWVTIAFNFTGGSLLRWARDELFPELAERGEAEGKSAYVLFDEMASSFGRPASILVLPHFTVTGTPHLDTKAKGAIVGLTLETSRAELLRALFEGVTYEMRLNLDVIERAGVEVTELRAIGGGAKSRLWLGIKANIFGKPIKTLAVSEAACLGAALLAGVAVGEYRSLEEGVEATVKVVETIEPDEKLRPAYEERYAIYRELYPRLKEVAHRLDDLRQRGA